MSLLRREPLSRLDWVLISLYLVAALSVYLLLHGIYRPENMDDAVFPFLCA